MMMVWILLNVLRRFGIKIVVKFVVSVYEMTSNESKGMELKVNGEALTNDLSGKAT